MKLDQQDSDNRKKEFVSATVSGNWKANVEQFATVLAQRDKLYLVAKSLCVHYVGGNHDQAEAMLTLLLNEVSEITQSQASPTELRDQGGER